MAVLGSTGSIGTTALKVIARHQDRFQVVALTAHSNGALLREQASEFHPGYVALVNCTEEQGIDDGWRRGSESLIEAATRERCRHRSQRDRRRGWTRCDARRVERWKARRAREQGDARDGRRARREGSCRRRGEIVPVDSEHSAILQCIAGRDRREMRRVILTASGGPFRGWSAEADWPAPLADALQHPTWRWDARSPSTAPRWRTRRSRSIEAHFLFGLPYDAIEVVVHPQSVVHSFVEFVDGSVLAQMGVPSMELPVLYALTHPDRVPDTGVPRVRSGCASPMTFEPVAGDEFPGA